ncbi:insect cuticle protein domain-containing protein [Phthorimaea operculella]|nr:insect cuticle protein domain-containing protein [Phthorimaea operculella]
MKLQIVFAAILAVSLAREIGSPNEEKEELVSQDLGSNLELMKINKEKEPVETAAPINAEVQIAPEEIEKEDNVEHKTDSGASLVRKSRENNDLHPEAATYNNNYIPPSQRPPRPWNSWNKPQNNIPPQNQNYIPNTPAQNPWNNQANVPQNNYIPTPVQPPQNNYVPNQPNNPGVQSDQQQAVPPSNYYPTVPQNNYPQNTVPQNNYPQNTNPQNTYPQNTVPQNTYPQNTVPQNNVPQNNVPQNTYYPQTPQNEQQKPQNDWYYPAVIKNDQYFGDNGNYNYEYQIADGTHVREQGWLVNPNTENESVVKQGWYSYPGADGRIYAVTWWADESGYHAYGDHLPTPPPVPAAIQAALDQQAAKDEAEKNKPVSSTPVYYPSSTQAPVYYPPVTQAPYYPQQTYPQQTYPQQNYPQQTYPQQNYPQQQYPQQQQIKPGHYGK